VLFRQRGVQSGWASLPETLPVRADQILRVDDNPSRPEAGSLKVIVNGAGMNGSPLSSTLAPACPCEIRQDPQVVSNPPDCRRSPHAGQRLHRLPPGAAAPASRRASLGAWRPAPGDLGLQILEWWAYLADVLTFYNERIANEAYLQTAQFPDSIAGLVGLLGYVPAPGLAATGQVGAIRTPPARPSRS